MKILRVGIKNINSLRLEAQIDFVASPLGDTGLFAIVGDTGAGKTTILDAITLGLYGKVARQADPFDVLTYGATDAYAEVEFETATAIYKSKWSLWRAGGKPTGKLNDKRELAKWNPDSGQFDIVAEKKKEVDDQVEATCGLDYLRFTKSVLLAQGDFAAFMKAKDQERSDLLERITGAEIYSQLSVAAHEKQKSEKQKLDLLEQERNALRLLTDEEKEALNAEISAQESAGKRLQAELAALRQTLSLLERATLLNTKKEQASTTLKNWEIDWENAQSDFLKLEKHQRAAPFHPEILQLETLGTRRQQLEIEISVNQNQLVEFENNVAKSQADLDLAEAESNHLKEESPARFELFEIASGFDIQFAERQKNFEKYAAEAKKIELELEEIQTQKAEIEGDVHTVTEKQTILSQWQKDHERFHSLPKQMPLIESLREELIVNWKQKKATEERLTEQETEFAKVELERSNAQQEWDKLTAKRAQIQAEFASAVPANFAQTRSDLLHLLSREIEGLTSRRKSLEQLAQMATDYQRMLAELDDYEAKVGSLEVQENEVNRQIMSSLEVLEEVQKRLAFKRQIYEQQALIEKYEHDRVHLREGEPCPLCASTVHPFRSLGFTPFVSESKAEFEAVSRQFDELSSRHKALLNRQFDLHLSIEQFKGSELKSLAGQLEQQFKKILEFEERIASFSSLHEMDGMTATHEMLVKEHLKATDRSILEKKALRDRLLALHSDLEKTEELEKIATAKLNEIGKVALKLTEQKGAKKQEFETLLQENAKKVDNLDVLLRPFDLAFDEKNARQLFEELKMKSQQWEETEKSLLDTQNQLKTKELALTQVVERAKNFQLQKTEFDKNIAAVSDEMAQIREKRTSVFGDKDPKIERENWQLRLAEMDKTVVSLKEQAHHWQSAASSVTQVLAELSKQTMQITTQLEKANTELARKIKTAGFTEVEELKNSILEEFLVKEIIGNREILQKKKIELDENLASTEKEILEIQQLISDKPSFEELKVTLQIKENHHLEIQQQIGSLREKLSANDRSSQDAAALLEKSAIQKTEYHRWAKLSDLIGSHDGKKFRAFAQSLTLDKLVFLANRHLEKLNGRFLIQKRNLETLELDIVDTYHADTIRSLKTLSGGETFIVSLALALGLSDLAGRNANIRSLFIDEGFGTLDENTLDTVITTLENLQSTGKTIGIISHVKTLKERITTQIRVQKRGNGFSEIEVIS